jgi:hypothetical protein
VLHPQKRPSSATAARTLSLQLVVVNASTDTGTAVEVITRGLASISTTSDYAWEGTLPSSSAETVGAPSHVLDQRQAPAEILLLALGEVELAFEGGHNVTRGGGKRHVGG